MREWVIGEPFNPWPGSCGFWPEDIVDRQRDLGGGPKRVYRRLRSYAGKNGSCFPSQQTLAADLGKCERQVRRDLDALETAGLIASKSRDGRRSNTYLFLWHAMFEQTRVSGQANDLSGHNCPVNKASANESEPNVSARDRTDMTGVTGHPCPPNSFSESFQRDEQQQAAAGMQAERDTQADVPRKPPRESHSQDAHTSGSSAGRSGLRDEDAVEGFPEMQTLLTKYHVGVRRGQIQALINAGRKQRLTLDGIFAFAEDKLTEKRDHDDPVYSAKLLINAISDDADFHRWEVKRHRCSSFFEQTAICPQVPFSVAELKAHLSTGAQQLRSLTGYDEIATGLDLLVVDTEAQMHDLETLEQRLAAFEKDISAIALAQTTEADRAQIQREIDSQLGPYRGKMSKEQLAMLEHQYLEQQLFESIGLPRLSLFYLRGPSRAAA